MSDSMMSSGKSPVAPARAAERTGQAGQAVLACAGHGSVLVGDALEQARGDGKASVLQCL
jgi:hypothetical protein